MMQHHSSRVLVRNNLAIRSFTEGHDLQSNCRDVDVHETGHGKRIIFSGSSTTRTSR